ncbi:hypothetical protein EMIHUDRAFT_372600, partial [Emiliania huxleyi CCMP1516]|uniref:BTB domain-containing protein n=2 Tax=Emiliania huxleyi TaxID=2903 RepID=A0A0D3HZ46_EMIH1
EWRPPPASAPAPAAARRAGCPCRSRMASRRPSLARAVSSDRSPRWRSRARTALYRSVTEVGIASDHAGAWYVATKDSLLHVSAAGRVRRVAALPASKVNSIATSPNESAAFVADYSSHKIRRVEVATGAVTMLAGSGNDGAADSVGDAAQFCYPTGIAISPDSSALFVTDFGSHKIRRVEVATGEVTTLAGSGESGDADGVGDAAQFCYPTGIAISPDGGALFVADYGNDKIRRVEVATGEVTTIAGSGTSGSADGVGDAAEFDEPEDVAISADGSTCLRGGASSASLLCPDRHTGRRLPPRGEVTFLCNLCARSPVFRTMFGIGMKERDAAEVTVAHTDLASFTALVRYLLTDQFDLGEAEGGRAQRALDLRELAQMYRVPRLELLCAQALQESVAPATAVPLLEAAHTMGDGRPLLAQCRRYVADHAAEVRASGGVEQLRDFGVAKGLLGDALDQVAELKGT